MLILLCLLFPLSFYSPALAYTLVTPSTGIFASGDRERGITGQLSLFWPERFPGRVFKEGPGFLIFPWFFTEGSSAPSCGSCGTFLCCPHWLGVGAGRSCCSVFSLVGSQELDVELEPPLASFLGCHTGRRVHSIYPLHSLLPFDSSF